MTVRHRLPHENYRRRLAGFSLIELMVTMAITTIGLVGLAFTLLESDRFSQENTYQSLAMNMVDDLGHRIRLNAQAYADYDTAGAAASCTSQPSQCAAWHNGSSQQAAANCSTSELAAYDLWDIACAGTINDSSADYTYSSSADSLPNPELIVSVNDNQGYNASSSEVRITLSWDVRTAGQDDEGNAVYSRDQASQYRSSVSTEFSLWHND
ncbi:prepilin-type N-terminal cleavage/methylation domain-containing protein [Oceanobacter kriegii]|uniref:prepilin-type N-terminal cleavage/methylation domain-containing protein n=1 Tax=Oceanobacter kriegii TaxID=64972 RepID=UPI000409A0ED|nr:prepilin-type N-terminal cleavage/methylation domain-containing protein [Oceanobacter kriegii]